MQVATLKWTTNAGWQKQGDLPEANLVIYFCGKGIIDKGERYSELKSFYPNAHIVGCSTGGEIKYEEVSEGSIVAAAIKLEKTPIKTAAANIISTDDSFDAGVAIAESLKGSDLASIFLLSDGTNINGSELINGLYSVLDEKIVVTGGLAGDAADFGKTFVGLDNDIASNKAVAIGFYGNNVKTSYGSVGGWSPFGPKRIITKSKGNILYELDGEPALDLYKRYIGDEANKLPSSGLLYPLGIRPADDVEYRTVRTIIGVDEKSKSMTFAGNIPEGYLAELMHGSTNSLIEGAHQAATLANADNSGKNGIAILVSCIGRKLLLGQRTGDEAEAVSNVLGNIPIIGFYSYGEICQQQFTKKCNLHNQTMTVTIIHENA